MTEPLAYPGIPGVSGARGQIPPGVTAIRNAVNWKRLFYRFGRWTCRGLGSAGVLLRAGACRDMLLAESSLGGWRSLVRDEQEISLFNETALSGWTEIQDIRRI